VLLSPDVPPANVMEGMLGVKWMCGTRGFGFEKTGLPPVSVEPVVPVVPAGGDVVIVASAVLFEAGALAGGMATSCESSLPPTPADIVPSGAVVATEFCFCISRLRT